VKPVGRTSTWDVVVIGAGPAGLFAARELSGKLDTIVLDRNSLAGGAGGMTDGKLNLSHRVGLDLTELQMRPEEAEERIAIVDRVFLEHGVEPELLGDDDERGTEQGRWDITLVPVKQRHMGTDFAPRVVASLTKAIADEGVTFSLETEVEDVRREDTGAFTVNTSKGDFKTFYLLAAPGREGAYWFRNVATSLGVATRHGAIDVGCRVEVARAVYDEITQVIYDPKFLFVTPTHRDRTRTFCTNPGGMVCMEDNHGFRLVNGHAFRDHRTTNTNFAILNTVTMTEPLQDNTEMGRKVMEFANFWGGGRSLILQRWGDFRAGRRSKAESFYSSDLGYDKMRPTLPPGDGATPGDISFAYPGRIVDNLRDSLILLSRVIPGVAHPSTTIYVPEIKFYDVRYPTSPYLETGLPNLFVAGDGAGKSRGIVGAALSGALAAEGILRKARGWGQTSSSSR
jgi:uncharacterized FAD-dependent dehydrogenase